MSLDQDIELLSQVALFDEFHTEHLRLLAFGANKISVQPGSEIFQYGATADSGYIISSGTVEIFSGNQQDDKIIGQFGRASLIGELAMISKSKRNTTAIAKDNVELIEITRTLFRRMLLEYPDLAINIHAKISNNVQSFITRLQRIQWELDRTDTVSS